MREKKNGKLDFIKIKNLNLKKKKKLQMNLVSKQK